MESTVEQLPKSTVRVKVTLAPADMTKYFSAAAERIAGQVKISGFRQGKAPRPVVESRVGQDALAHEAMELAVADGYYQAVKKHDLKPIGRPETDLKHEHAHLERDGLSFTATVPVLPPVDLGDYKQLKVKPTEATFDQKQVDETLAQLQKSRASFAKVPRGAKTGDQVEIDFVGTLKGKEVEGAKSEHHPLVIGEDNFVPGFAEELVGLKEGQVKKFKVKFPKDYHEPALAGQPVEFTVTMGPVQERTVPKVDDAFAKNFGADSVKELKDRLAENLKAEKETEAQRETESAVIDKVIAQAKTEVPDALLEDELTRMIGELKTNIERQGIPYDKYLEHLKKTEDEIRKEQRPEAERRVKMSLILNEVQRVESLEPSEVEIKAEVDEQLTAAPDDETRQRIEAPDFRDYVRQILGNRLAVKKLVDYATS